MIIDKVLSCIADGHKILPKTRKKDVNIRYLLNHSSLDINLRGFSKFFCGVIYLRGRLYFKVIKAYVDSIYFSQGRIFLIR